MVGNLGACGTTPLASLQKPKGYGNPFTWEGYLQETNSRAVPKKFFKSGQIVNEGVLSAAERNAKNQELFDSAKEGELEQVKKLIDQYDCYPDVGVAGAVVGGHLELIKFLLNERDASVDAPISSGKMTNFCVDGG